MRADAGHRPRYKRPTPKPTARTSSLRYLIGNGRIAEGARSLIVGWIQVGRLACLAGRSHRDEDREHSWESDNFARYFAGDVGGPGPQVDRPDMDAAYDPGAWHDFGVAFVSASAALLGLVFVVVSLHLRAVVDDPGASSQGRDHARAARDDARGVGGARDPGSEPRGARSRADAGRAGLHSPVEPGDLPRDSCPARRRARPPPSAYSGRCWPSGSSSSASASSSGNAER